MTNATRPPSSQPVRLGLGLASLALAGFLLLGFKAPQDAALASRSSGTSGGAGTTGTSGSTASSGTIDGTVVDTRYGPVQVEVTVSNGKVTAVTAVELPSGGRSGAISGYASPILSSEALTAQSSNIDLVSGATYTSEAFASSLQAALNRAGI
jgi:uncharacterized protein with FMN-binding domain